MNLFFTVNLFKIQGVEKLNGDCPFFFYNVSDKQASGMAPPVYEWQYWALQGKKTPNSMSDMFTVKINGVTLH